MHQCYSFLNDPIQSMAGAGKGGGRVDNNHNYSVKFIAGRSNKLSCSDVNHVYIASLLIIQ